MVKTKKNVKIKGKVPVLMEFQLHIKLLYLHEAHVFRGDGSCLLCQTRRAAALFDRDMLQSHNLFLNIAKHFQLFPAGTHCCCPTNNERLSLKSQSVLKVCYPVKGLIGCTHLIQVNSGKWGQELHDNKSG